MDSITVNMICQSVGFRVALDMFDYNYTENDAIFDEIYCTGFSQSCTYKLHAQGQPCDSFLAMGIVCSDGEIQKCYLLHNSCNTECFIRINFCTHRFFYSYCKQHY